MGRISVDPDDCGVFVCPQCPALHRRTSHWRSSTHGWVMIQQHSLGINYAAEHKRWLSCAQMSLKGFPEAWVLIWALYGWVERVCVMKSAQQGFVHYSFTLVCVCLYQSSSDKPTLEQSNTHYLHSWDIYSWYAEIRVGLNCRGLGWIHWIVKRADLCKTHEVRNTHALNSFQDKCNIWEVQRTHGWQDITRMII